MTASLPPRTRYDSRLTELGTEQVARELDRVPAGDAVADGERGDRRLQVRFEGAARELGGKLRAGLGGASGGSAAGAGDARSR